MKNESNPNNAYEKFIEIFYKAYDIAFPVKEVSIKTKTLLDPWFTKGIKKSSKKKQKLYEKFLKKGTKKNEEIYKTYKNLFERVKKYSKKSYYQDQLFKYKDNIKKTWGVIKEVIGKSKMRSNFPNRVIVKNKEITNKLLIAENFN